MTAKDEWNKLMRGLPETAFMEIMNNYLGGIKTPYDKNELLDRLTTRLTRPDYIQSALFHLTPPDRQILSAVKWFGQADRAELTDFFSGDLPSGELSSRIINLEERLLLFYNRDGNKAGYILSPLLPDEIHRQLGPENIIHFHKDPLTAPQGMPLVNGSFLICFTALLNEDIRISNNDGSIKKRFTSALIKAFPQTGFTDEPDEKLHLLLNGMKTLSFLTESSMNWRFRIENLRRFSQLPRREQLLWFWGALCTREFSRIPECSLLIAALAKQIPLDCGLKQRELERMVVLIKAGQALHEKEIVSLTHIIRILKLFGFFIPKGDYWYLHPMIPALLDQRRPADGSFFLHATFDANLTPDTPFSLPLAMALGCERYDSFAQLHLTAASFKRFLKAGLSLEDMKEELVKRYGLPLPQNILFSLQEWEDDYNSLRLWEGIVLEVSSEKVPLINQSPRLQHCIRRPLAEGIYLLAKEDRPQWEEALNELGIETIPRTESPGKKVPEPKDFSFQDLSLPRLIFSPETEQEEENSREESSPGTDALTEMVKKHDGFSEEEKEDLLSRIDRGIIYREDQIRPGMIRRELTLVKGLDYQGKLRMIKAVMGSRAYQLDITLPTDDFDLITHRILPRALEQEQESQDILTGIGENGMPFRCPVRKISRIRKIRTSLF